MRNRIVRSFFSSASADGQRAPQSRALLATQKIGALRVQQVPVAVEHENQPGVRGGARSTPRRIAHRAPAKVRAIRRRSGTIQFWNHTGGWFSAGAAEPPPGVREPIASPLVVTASAVVRAGRGTGGDLGRRIFCRVTGRQGDRETSGSGRALGLSRDSVEGCCFRDLFWPLETLTAIGQATLPSCEVSHGATSEIRVLRRCDDLHRGGRLRLHRGQQPKQGGGGRSGGGSNAGSTSGGGSASGGGGPNASSGGGGNGSSIGGVDGGGSGSGGPF